MMASLSSHTNVILNLFQDPLCLHASERAVARMDAWGTLCASIQATGDAEKWALKQVQVDEIFGGVVK